MRLLALKLSLLILLSTRSSLAGPVNADELAQARRWVAAKFEGKSEEQPARAYLMDHLRGARLMKNVVTTRVYYVESGALPLKIADKVYDNGLYFASEGDVVVHLPRPAKSFEAIFGVDSNRVTSFYSNAGRGRVVGSVRVGGAEGFRSQVMREGMKGVPVQVDLGGAREFTLSLKGLPAGVVQRVNFNQADWANARVTMSDGEVIKLGDLPVAPLRANFNTDPPFSFRYGGRHSSEFLHTWQTQRHTKQLDENRVERTVTYRDSKTGLEVRCVGIEYRDYPVIEWKLWLKNTSEQPTPILEDILPIDTRFERRNEGEFTLHHANGATHSLVSIEGNDYAPRTTTLRPKMEKTLGSKVGLPASHDLPFWNIESPGGGVIMAIGWPGQWTASLKRDKGRALHVQAGQERVHFYLEPGEEVRTPMIALLFWQGGDWIRAQNVWRRWMIAHNLPRAGGTVHPPQHAAAASAQYIEVSTGTEENQLAFVKRYLEEGIKPDYWWVDAGWYSFKDYWLNVGTWEPDPVRFPRGLSPVSDFLHANDMKMILWYSPELVTLGSALHRDHPQWLLKRGGALWWTGHALFQGEVSGHVDDSGLTMLEDIAAFGIGPEDDTIAGRTFLADGKWHLVTATRSVDADKSVSHLRLYVDGKLDAQGSSTNTRTLDANDSWGVGRQSQGRGIVGEIDDARVYDAALTAEEVQALFRRKLSKSPVSRYTFDGHLKDSARNLTGDRTGSGEPRFVDGPSKESGDRALRFDNNYGIKIANTASKNFTLSCWVRMEKPQPPPYAGRNFRLLNLGNPDAVEWLTNHVDEQIKEQGVDLYRHDGIPTLSYWRANDTEDRQGITEIRHVQGYLKFWDELRRRHPNLRSDICSGGGSRNDLEGLRRAVPLWRSDYAYEPTGMQTLTYGMSFWIPYFGTGTNAFDSYTFRSQMAPAIVSVWDLRRRDSDYQFCRTMLSQWREVADYYYGDFYPLTAYRLEDDVWMAWQFDRPEKGEGMVQAFRRPKSPAVTMDFKLRGLEREARYRVRNVDKAEELVMTGRALLEQGLSVSLEHPREAALIVYKRQK
jgi:hypothetical protein